MKLLRKLYRKFLRVPAPTEKYFYFLNNASHYISHVLPLYKRLGGEFIVISKKVYEECLAAGVKVRYLDDCPDAFVHYNLWRVQRTVKYLNRPGVAVFFFGIFSICEDLDLPKKVMLFHGNSFKDWFSDWRLAALKDFDYITALSPYRKLKMISGGIPEEKMLDIGMTRWDDVIKHAGKIEFRDELAKRFKFDPKKKLIAYLPTWYGPSSIHSLGLEILKNIGAQYNLIFSMHPATPPELAEKYIALAKTKSNVTYLTPADYAELDLTKLYAAVDLFIGDMGGIMTDVLLTDKPLIYAFDKGENRQSESVYEPIKEVFAVAGKLDHANVNKLNELLEKHLKAGINERAWQTSKSRMFYSLSGNSTGELAEFISQKVVERR